MQKIDAYRVILDEWSSSLSSRDRTKHNIKPNFEDLFQRWKDVGGSFEELYDSFLRAAIIAHLPQPSIARRVYKILKKSVPDFDKSEKEFIASWNKNIEDIGRSTFLEFFPAPIPIALKKEQPSHGNMSASEYRAQRRYADQFPILDTTELEARWNDRQYNLDIEDMIKNVLGDNNEANSGTN